MIKVIVTGGAGFIGSHLVDALVARGDEVHVVDTLVAGKFPDRMNADAHYHEVDIRNVDALAPIFSGAKYVFHTAAIPRVPYSIEHPVETTDVNVVGTVAVFSAAVTAGVSRVVHSSSGSVYGTQTTMPLSESLEVHPVSPYALQKYVGEQYAVLWAELYGLETVSLRYFNVYGPKLDPVGPYALAVGRFLLAKKNGEPITIFGDGTITRDYTHVSDIVRANILSAESPKVGKGEVINVGAGRNVTIQYLAELVGAPIQYGPPRVEAPDSQADTSRAKELLGWEPQVTLEDGIEELKQLWGIV